MIVNGYAAKTRKKIGAKAKSVNRRRIRIGPLTKRATGLAPAPKGKTDRQLIEEALIDRFGL
jgi:hypothetical protein